MDDQTRRDIEERLLIAPELSDPALLRITEQDLARGGWPSPREQPMPHPPWPARSDPVLRFLLAKASVSIEAGLDVEDVLADLAIHAWFEGGIENYDRGQADARHPHSA